MPVGLNYPLLQSLTGRHPARRMGFDELYAGLQNALREKNVTVSRDDGLELYAYTSLCQFDRRWDRFSLIARGLVLDPAARQVAATPFPKFFNFNEGPAGMHQLPDEPFEVTEKIDGSLGIVFHHAGRWRVTTRGMLTSDQGRWATDFLNRQVATDRLVPGTTYLVEIVYPANRIVIPYDFEALVLLAAYDEKGDELPRPALEQAAAAAGLRLAGSRAYASLDELVSVAKSLCRDEEGFVIRFASGLRVKLKGEEYCRVHRLLCHCSPLALWEAMGRGDDVHRMRGDLPEEMRTDFDAIRRLIDGRFDGLIAEIRAAYDATAALTDKQVGQMVQDPASPLTTAARRFVFMARKPGFFERVRAPGEFRDKVFRAFRPDGNRLSGYRPSDAMTRFAAENE